MARSKPPRRRVEQETGVGLSYALLESIIERVSDGFVALDRDWRYVYVNEKAARMLGREKPEDLIGKHIWTEYPEGVGQSFYHACYRAMETQQAVYLEEYYEPWDRWFETRIYPSLDGLTIYFIEITEHKRAERALLETERQLRLAIRAANVGLWDWDLRTNQVHYSLEWKKQLGYEDHEISDDFNEWEKRLHPEDLEGAIARIRAFLAEPGPLFTNEFRMRHKDGSYRWILAQASLLFDDQGRPIHMLGSHIDITEQKATLEVLRRTNERLAALHQTDRDIIAAHSLEDTINAVVHGLRRLIPCEHITVTFLKRDSSEAMVVASVADGSTTLQNARVPITDLPWLELMRGGEMLFIPDLLQLEARTSIVTQLIQDGIRAIMVAPMLVEGQLLGFLSLNSATPGFFTAEHWEIVEEKASILAIAFHQVFLREQIQRQNLELEQRVAERTAQLEAKNRELETFTYTVSHDLKAPLRGIDGYSRLLLEDYLDRLGEEGRCFLENIRAATNQMGELIEDLLAYSRLERRPLRTDQVSVQRLVQSLVAERAVEIKGHGVQVTQAVPDVTVTADPDGLAMALRNLLDNALKFTSKVEAPLIEVGGRETTETCILWVRDNGIGFDMKYHDRILQIFQRLHRSEDYPGTGIGLAIVQKAMERMGGRVWAESEPGHGATFYLEVPK